MILLDSRLLVLTTLFNNAVLKRPLGLSVDTGVLAEQLVQEQREGGDALGRCFYIHDGSCWLLGAVWPASGPRCRNRADTL